VDREKEIQEFGIIVYRQYFGGRMF